MVTYTAEHRARFALVGNIRFIYNILGEDHYEDPNFNRPVYYYASDLEHAEVGNPMKKFIKKHSICRSVLDAR